MRDSYDIFFDSENEVYQIRTKEEIIIIKFSDKEKEKIFKEIISFYDKNDFYTYSKIKNDLSGHSQDKIMDVVRELIQCSLLNRENFGSEDLTIDDDQKINERNLSSIEEKKVGYIGMRSIGKELEEAAKTYNYASFKILEVNDSLKEEDIKDLIGNCDFFIADIATWSPYHIDLINQTALNLNKPWLLIEGMVGGGNFSIGPIFHGRETGCYDCYSSRIKANDELSTYNQSYESYLRDEKKFSKPVKTSELINQYIASVIILDISKFIGGWFIPATWRTVLFFNTRSYEVTKHDFLKTPLCSTCHPELDYNKSPWFESVTLK